MEEKVAVVTGGGGYIGGETAKRLAQSGMRVAVCDISKEAADSTVAVIRALGGSAEGYRMDVTDPADVNRVWADIVRELGRVDVCVHVAGGSARIAGKDARYLPLIEQEDYVIDRVLKVNLYGAIYVSRAAAKQMKAQGFGGRIILFSSTVGINGLATCTEYAAAKGGVIALTKSLAKEVGPYKITVNSIAPGIVMRPEETGTHRAFETNFLHEKCTAADIAALVNFMVGDEARFITGQTYVCDGGRSLAMKGTD